MSGNNTVLLDIGSLDWSKEKYEVDFSPVQVKFIYQLFNPHKVLGRLDQWKKFESPHRDVRFVRGFWLKLHSFL